MGQADVEGGVLQGRLGEGQKRDGHEVFSCGNRPAPPRDRRAHEDHKASQGEAHTGKEELLGGTAGGDFEEVVAQLHEGEGAAPEGTGEDREGHDRPRALKEGNGLTGLYRLRVLLHGRTCLVSVVCSDTILPSDDGACLP